MKSLTLALLVFAAVLFAGAQTQQPGPPGRAAFARTGVEQPGPPGRAAFARTGVEQPGPPGRAAFARAGVEQPAQPDDVPVTDAGSGPCSIELSVTSSDGKPVYAAKIDYHAAYGFMGTRKLDMTVYTNAQGKAKFTGIPAKVKNPPIEFHASKNALIGVATMDPAAECQAKHDIVMDKKGSR